MPEWISAIPKDARIAQEAAARAARAAQEAAQEAARAAQDAADRAEADQAVAAWLIDRRIDNVNNVVKSARTGPLGPNSTLSNAFTRRDQPRHNPPQPDHK